MLMNHLEDMIKCRFGFSKSVVEFRPRRSKQSLRWQLLCWLKGHILSRHALGRVRLFHICVSQWLQVCRMIHSSVRWDAGQLEPGLMTLWVTRLFAYPHGMKPPCILKYKKPCPRILVFQSDLFPGLTLPLLCWSVPLTEYLIGITFAIQIWSLN